MVPISTWPTGKRYLFEGLPPSKAACLVLYLDRSISILEGDV